MMDQLIKYLISRRALRSPAIIDAFRAVDRRDFVPPAFAGRAYDDAPLPLAAGQTISQPTVVAFMLEQLAPRAGDKILDLGAGSGWTTALLGQLVGPSGQIHGVEITPELVTFGRKNLQKYNLPQTTIEPAATLGKPAEAPFDKILVSAAGKKIPRALTAQLANGGTMIIPVNYSIVRLDKNSRGQTHQQIFPGFVFVPLVDKLNK